MAVSDSGVAPPTTLRWRRAAAATGEAAVTAAAYAVLHHLGLVADVPVPVFVGLLVAVRIVEEAHEATMRGATTPAWLHTSLAIHAAGATAVIYATGWGAALIGVGYPISLTDRARTHGSLAYRYGLCYALAGAVLGQLAVGTGLAPTRMEFPLVHGLAALSTLGMVFLVKQLEWSARGRERAQAEVERSEARFRALVQNASDMIVVLDAEGRMTYVSPSIELMGYTPEELTGRNGFELVHPDDLDDALVEFESVLSTPGQKATVELRARHADGSWHWHEAVGQNLLDLPAVDGIVVNFREITERRQAADALSTHAERLEQANRVKDEFVATVSHELRTPLTSLTGATKTIRERWPGLEEEQKLQLLDSMDRQADRLGRMVEDLLVMSRLVRADIVAAPRPVEVSVAVHEAVEMVVGEPGSVTVDVPHDLHARVDPDHLNRVLCNLLSNAFKYGAPPVAVDVTATPDDRVEVRVRDHGPGIADDFLPDLFEKFAQHTSGDTRSSQGLGLGLAITRSLMEANGGEIAYEPNQPRGACFVVRLPGGAVSAAPAQAEVTRR